LKRTFRLISCQKFNAQCHGTPSKRVEYDNRIGFFGGEILAVFISLAAGGINVNSLNRGSLIAVGENSQPGWNQNGKSNFGNGQLFGANVEFAFVSNVFDNDVVDNPIVELQPAPSIQNQTL
jgi:hypothetical protein